MDEATHKKNFKPINIRDLFNEKNPALARWNPGFVYRWLSRILRIDFFNDSILYRHGYKKDVEFARASIEALNVTLDVVGSEKLPPEGRFIFAANHPLGGFDGMMIISELCRHYSHLKVLVNDILMNVKNMDGIFVPINKHGTQAKENLRKFMGIKTNLEMFFLPNESYKHRNKHFVITFGKPIPYQTFDHRFTPHEWAQLVKDHTYLIAGDPQRKFSYLKPQTNSK